MDLSFGTIVSGILLGIIGTAIFIYGKRETNIRCLAAGVAICVLPYLVASLALCWALAVACLGALYWTSRNAA